MAITDTQKVDYLFKKVGFGATKTDINSVKGATNESIPSPLLIRGDKILGDAGRIPAVKPATTSGVVQCCTNITNVTSTSYKYNFRSIHH